MAIRGVYTKEEEKMLADYSVKSDLATGWFKLKPREVASEASIKAKALASDPWNPLWRDENYAIKTRWGSIIAPPLYQGMAWDLDLPEVKPSIGYLDHWWIGEDWELFKPVRVNDIFKVWRRRPTLEDVTSSDKEGPRKFRLVDYDLSIMNQKDELVNTYKRYLEVTILPGPLKKAEPKPLYIYTKEELEFINHIEDDEEICGANIRYWENVSIGDELRPIVTGPTTVWDQILFWAGHIGLGPLSNLTREMRKKMPERLVLDPVTGVTHPPIDVHFDDNVAQMGGNPRTFHFGGFGAQVMARLITNWMGDDGFIRKFNWRHLARTAIGDSVIGKGKVINKRVNNGEHLVDLEVWLENIRGNVTEASVASVNLFSKEGI